MNTVCKENMCAGCMACLEVCSKAAIIVKDNLKGYNAVIDENLCINCGACHKVCPNNQVPELLKSVCWYQGWSIDMRDYSSSGGVAAGLIAEFIKQGGIVCSCAFRDGKFGFYFAPNEIQPKEYIGSKYVKSSPEGIYRKVQQFLDRGKKVLFLGLPCQVAAIKSFIGKKYQDSLYTVDLICHGSPSPELLNLFLNDYGLSLTELEKINFRNKSEFKLQPNVRQIEPIGVQDAYTFAFLKGLDYTENCYHCQYARKERVSDITLGDSWGSDLDEEEKQKGISLILCQTEKGKKLVNSANLQLCVVDYEKAVKNNLQLRHPSMAPAEREKFFEMIKNSKKFKYSVLACYPKYYLKQNIKKVLIKLKIILPHTGIMTDYGICVTFRAGNSTVMKR